MASSQRPHVRHTKYGTVHAGRGSKKNRRNKRNGRRRSGFSGTSHKVMTKGRLTRQRKKQVWSRVAWSTSGTASFMFFQQRRYTAAAIFGVFAVGFGAIDLGMTIHRRRQERRAKRAKLEAKNNRSSRSRTTAPRPTVRARVRTNLESGTQAAAARKPSLNTKYRNAEKERREEKAKAEMGFVG